MCVCVCVCARARILQVREGDHLTLVNVFRAYEAARRSPQWCQARQVHSHSESLRVAPSHLGSLRVTTGHSESV